MTDIYSVRENVEILLETDETCRDSDNYLILKYWAMWSTEPQLRSVFQNVLDILGFWRIQHQLVGAETIRRTRQTVQNGPNGKFKPSPKALEGRLNKQKLFLDYARSKQK